MQDSLNQAFFIIEISFFLPFLRYFRQKNILIAVLYQKLRPFCQKIGPFCHRFWAVFQLSLFSTLA